MVKNLKKITKNHLEIIAITNSTGSHAPGSGIGSTPGSESVSSSGFQSEKSAFSRTPG